MNAASIGRATGGQETGGGWWLIPCPVHGGPELRVKIRDGGNDGLLVKTEHCASGCKRQGVIAALQAQYANPKMQIPTNVNSGGPDPSPSRRYAKTLRAVSSAEFVQMELPPREAILEPWLHTQGLAMIHAPRGVGKTFLALSIAHAVAAGLGFLNWKAPKPRGVLYLDGELPAAAMQERMRQLSAAIGEPKCPLSIITPDLQPGGMPDLADPEWQDAVGEHIANDIDLIVVDNVSTLVRSGKENEAESWEPVQQWALSLRAKHKSVLFIHHSGKGGAQRGTSRREDVLDTVFALRRPADYRSDQGAVFEVHVEKGRQLHGKDAEPFEAKLASGANGLLQWTARSLEQSTQQRVAALLAEGLSQQEIAEQLKLNKSTVSRYSKRAKESGES
jgi:hypothetical protein